MTEREAAVAYILAFAEHYPLDLFPDVAASMARHICQVLAADIQRGLHMGEPSE